jgi:predicted TIM-barrel fold metal-dependent hydrolase
MNMFRRLANDEYVAPPLGPIAEEAARRFRDECDRLPRRIGMTRREFLGSACASALALLLVDACARESGGGRGGTYRSLPPEATTEPEAAATVLAGEEFVFDVQTHLLEEGGRFGQGFPQASCPAPNCFSTEHWLDLVFARSDTSLAVISAIPAATPFEGPLSIQVMERARRLAETAACTDRVLLHGQAVPTMPGALEAMAELADAHPIAAWKLYTHTPVPYRLDDPVGEAAVRRAVDLGLPIICVHKGFGADPVEMGPVARAHPDATFVVYHSGYEAGRPEAVDRLVRSLAGAGVGPGQNVYAELGSTWFNLMRSPDDAAHVLGKLLLAVGEDRVLWGTDSIWYGSPQEQIEAFRAFEITPEFQERFGYPALTAEVKRKILGLNAARLYGVDPVPRPRCGAPQ